MTSKTLILMLLCKLLYNASAQGGLPDSITTVDCLALERDSPHICCEPKTGGFCLVQCNNGLCRCVNPTTGVPTADFTFTEDDDSIDCSLEQNDEDDISKSDSDSTNSTLSSDGSDDTDFSRSNSTDGSGDIDTSDTDSSQSNGTRSDGVDENGDNSMDQSDFEESSDGDESDTNGTRSDSTTDARCPTVSQLLNDEDCTLSCLLEDDDGCPSCNDTCFSSLVLSTSLEETGSPQCDCSPNQACLRVGRFGEFACVNLLSEGERCDSERYEDDDDDDDDDKDDKHGSGDDVDKSDKNKRDADEASDSSAHEKVEGAKDRHNFGDLGGAYVGCQEGLVCTPVSIGKSECLPENPDGPCIIARQQGSDVQCSPDGDFEPLQVQSDNDDDSDDDDLRVVCVLPSDGSSISGTEVTVSDLDDAPDCDRLVGCSVERGGQKFDVPHGEFFIYVDDDDDDADSDDSHSDDDDAECKRCLCRNGEATLCETTNCTALLPASCSYEGESYEHGDTFEVDCNICGCRNGVIRCTRTQCDDSEIEDRCEDCRPLNQVCGINGITYDSPCAAVYCGGLAPFDFFQGACSNLDVCTLYPCRDGETCIRKGGATCFGSNGCDLDDLRLCVDRNSLVCDDDDDDDDDDKVCATNGVTYSSLCRLLQDTGNEAVAYAGECDREECQGRKVCGTDGVTYENACVLQSQSANARVDYDGDCDDDLDDDDDDDDDEDEICERVSSSGRCSYNSSNCQYLVNPEEGCCAICGGVVLIAMDLAGLREYVRINPTVSTLDDFMELLVDSDFIGDDITDNCDVEASLTTTGNIQIALTATPDDDDDDDDDDQFCNAASEIIAATINDLSLVPQSAQVPEVLQFASAALAAPNTVTKDVIDGVNAAPAFNALSYFTLLLLVILSCVLF